MASRDGWWIKFCQPKCECDSIAVSIGPDKNNVNERWTWTKGASPNEIDVSGPNKHHSKLYVYAKVGPRGKNGYLGVCYNEQVCNKHYDFDNDEDHDVGQGDRDEWKCN